MMDNIPWRPVTDFEKSIINESPENDFIFGSADAIPTCDPLVPRPTLHLKLKAKKSQQNAAKVQYLQNNENFEVLRVISQVQEIAGTKKLGEMPAVSDWDSYDNLERETIALMRHCGLKPSTDVPLHENKIQQNPPLAQKMTVVQYGGGDFPIYFDESYFKFPTYGDEIFRMEKDATNDKQDDNVPTTSTKCNIPRTEHHDNKRN